MSIQINIISYNYSHLLGQCLDSIFSQTKMPDVIKVIDDFSIDRHITYELCNKYNVEGIFRKENLGHVINFNTTLNETKTDKVMMLGADNYLRPDAIELMSNENADIVSSDIILVGPEANKFSNLVKGSRKYNNGYWEIKFNCNKNINNGNYIHGSSLYNVKLAKKVGGYEMSNRERPESDWMLWKKMINNGAIHLHICKCILYYRKHKFNYIKYK